MVNVNESLQAEATVQKLVKIFKLTGSRNARVNTIVRKDIKEVAAKATARIKVDTRMKIKVDVTVKSPRVMERAAALRLGVERPMSVSIGPATRTGVPLIRTVASLQITAA